tara:strand:+ start:1519 stop:1773 length:255 start_codon:yes stop_codon:yes gene_type:complete
MTIDDIQPGIILNYQSEKWPTKNSRWLVLEQLKEPRALPNGAEGKSFKIYCIKSSLDTAPDLNQSTTYTFHHGNIHRFSVHSQI